MTSSERAARTEELKADIARVRATRRAVLERGLAHGAEGYSRQNADLEQLRAEETALTRELSSLNRNGRVTRVYKFNY